MPRGQSDVSANANPLFGTRSAQKIDSQDPVQELFKEFEILLDKQDTDSQVEWLLRHPSLIGEKVFLDALAKRVGIDTDPEKLASELKRLVQDKELTPEHFSFYSLEELLGSETMPMHKMRELFHDLQGTLNGSCEAEREAKWAKILAIHTKDVAVPVCSPEALSEAADAVIKALDEGGDIDNLNLSVIGKKDYDQLLAIARQGELNDINLTLINNLSGSVFGKTPNDFAKQLAAPIKANLAFDKDLADSYEQEVVEAVEKGTLTTKQFELLPGSAFTEFAKTVSGGEGWKGSSAEEFATLLNTISDTQKQFPEIKQAFAEISEDATDDKVLQQQIQDKLVAKLKTSDFVPEDFEFLGKTAFQRIEAAYDDYDEEFEAQDLAESFLNNARAGLVPLDKNPFVKPTIDLVASATWPLPKQWGEASARRDRYSAEDEQAENEALRKGSGRLLSESLADRELDDNDFSVYNFPAKEVFELETLGPIAQSWIEASVSELDISPAKQPSSDIYKRIKDRNDAYKLPTPLPRDEYVALSKKPNKPGQAMKHQLVEHMVLSQDIINRHLQESSLSVLMPKPRISTLVSDEDGLRHQRVGDNGARTLCLRPLEPIGQKGEVFHPDPKGYRFASVDDRAGNSFFAHRDDYQFSLRRSLPSEAHGLECADCQSKAKLLEPRDRIDAKSKQPVPRVLDPKTESLVRSKAQTNIDSADTWEDFYKLTAGSGKEAAVERFVEAAKVVDHRQMVLKVAENLAREKWSAPAKVREAMQLYQDGGYFELPESVLKEAAEISYDFAFNNNSFQAPVVGFQQAIDNWAKTL